MKIRNITQSPQRLWASGSAVVIDPGRVRDDLVLTDAEATQVRDNTAVFATDAAAETGSAVAAASDAELTHLRAINGDLTITNASLASQLTGIGSLLGVTSHDQIEPALVGALKAATATAALVAALGVDPDNAIDEIARIKTMAAAERKPSLIEAVALLDDKNDGQWTSAGKPAVPALEKITGANHTRADVDALPWQRVRKTD